MHLIVFVVRMPDLQCLRQPVPEPSEAGLFFGSPKADADSDPDCERREACGYQPVRWQFSWVEFEAFKLGDKVRCALRKARVCREIGRPVAWGADAVTDAFCVTYQSSANSGA